MVEGEAHASPYEQQILEAVLHTETGELVLPRFTCGFTAMFVVVLCSLTSFQGYDGRASIEVNAAYHRRHPCKDVTME